MKTVWDPVVRFGHWALALAVLGSYALGEHGGSWHERLGYAALGVVAVRFVWDFLGSPYARFAPAITARSRDVFQPDLSTKE